MRGTKCKCGFATTADNARCPRCGKKTQKGNWPNSGRALAFADLQVRPEGFDGESDLAIIKINEDGPTICCWTARRLSVGDRVKVVERDNGRYRCEKVKRRRA